MEKTVNGKASLGEVPTLQPLTIKQVKGMVAADLSRIQSLLDCIFRDQDVFDCVCDGMLRRYENLRERQRREKEGDLFQKGVDEQSE